MVVVLVVVMMMMMMITKKLWVTCYSPRSSRDWRAS